MTDIIDSIKKIANTLEQIIIKCDHNNIKFNCLMTDNLIQKYSGNDWRKYVSFNKDKYNRIRLFSHERFDIWLICWDIAQGSSIHDHPEYGCIQKILQGSLVEKKYNIDNDGNLNCFVESELSEGMVGYIFGKNGLHRLYNNSNIGAVTLHIYSPPNYIPTIIKD